MRAEEGHGPLLDRGALLRQLDGADAAKILRPVQRRVLFVGDGGRLNEVPRQTAIERFLRLRIDGEVHRWMRSAGTGDTGDEEGIARMALAGDAHLTAYRLHCRWHRRPGHG